MRIYLLSEGVPHAPTETVKSVHLKLMSAMGHADEAFMVGYGQWFQDEFFAPSENFPAKKLWRTKSNQWTPEMYITEWETVE